MPIRIIFTGWYSRWYSVNGLHISNPNYSKTLLYSYTSLTPLLFCTIAITATSHERSASRITEKCIVCSKDFRSNDKGGITAPHYWPYVGESSSDSLVSLHKSVMRKMFPCHKNISPVGRRVLNRLGLYVHVDKEGVFKTSYWFQYPSYLF